MRKRSLVIGLDSLSSCLIEQFADEGALPTFANIAERSLTCATINPPNLGETAWPNFFTGSGAGYHGRYFNSQIVPGTYKTRIFDPRGLRAAPYWSALSDAGKNVIVVDVPKAGVARRLNGIAVANWANHDQEIDAGLSTWPRNLEHELNARYGSDPIARDDYGGNGPGDHAAFAKSIVQNIERKTRFLLDLVERPDWDHCVFVYDDAHAVSHYAWHLHDPEHPDHDAELAARIGDPLRTVCEALDAALGQVLERIDPLVSVSVLLSHGIGPAYHASYVTDEILRRFQGAPARRGTPVNPLRAVWRSIPLRYHDRLMPMQNILRDLLLEPDRRRREAFTLPAADDTASIRINLAGREPDGIVEPGREYDACCSRISEQMHSLVNADTGNPVVAGVTRVAHVCTGPYLDHLPDLIVEWRGLEPIRAVTAPGIGTVEIPARNSRTGSHTEAGMLFVLQSGARAESLTEPLALIDIAPSICALHGVELPNAEGRPVPQILSAMGSEQVPQTHYDASYAVTGR